MINYLLTCRSLTYAQRTAKALERVGISAILMRTPKEISINGCGYCVKVPEKRLSDALVALKNVDLAPSKVYISTSDGHFNEVSV